MHGYLFLDMNSFFASVEQQERRELRGRPVAVSPADVPTGCVIAASQEAKVYGVSTGCGVAQARELCPHIAVVEARPDVYRQSLLRIVKAVESCLPVTEVLSIDEMICRLWDNEQDLAAAMELGQRVQAEIRGLVGSWLRCSVGIGPNRLLAKVASDFAKATVSVIQHDDLPHKMRHLELTDWPGISKRMERRFHLAGVYNTERMYELSRLEMRRIWGGVMGDRWWRSIHGEDVPPIPTKRGQYGHSHVLAPPMRTQEGARQVATLLLERAAERMRHNGYHAQRLIVSVSGFKDPGWTAQVRFSPSRDTAHFLVALRSVWRDDVRRPSFAAVTLCDVLPDDDVTGSLFEPPDRELWKFVDDINARFGRRTVLTGSAWAARNDAPSRIPFGTIDSIDLPQA